MKVILSPGLSSLTGPLANLRFVRGRTGPYIRQPKTVIPPPTFTQVIYRRIWSAAAGMWSQIDADVKTCYATLNPNTDLTLFNLWMQTNWHPDPEDPDYPIITPNTPYASTLYYAFYYDEPTKYVEIYSPPGSADPTHILRIYGWQIQYPTKPYFRLSAYATSPPIGIGSSYGISNVEPEDAPDFLSLLACPPGVNMFSQATPAL